MYELNRTYARAIFKDLLGQANHFLITILVGLNGVRSKAVIVDEEFRTSWNPKNIARSADRSRFFALDLALIRAVDSLDTYMMRSRRKPLAISEVAFASSMDGTGQSVAKRLDVFDAHLNKLPNHIMAFAKLSIDWRNRRVHSLAKEHIDDSDIEELILNKDFFKENFSGLIISNLIDDYKKGHSPTFKDAAAIIRLIHIIVEHYDTCLLSNLDVEQYIRSLLFVSIFPSMENVTDAEMLVTCNKIWGGRDKREERIRRAIRLCGINETDTVTGRHVPDEIIELIMGLDAKNSVIYLKS